MKKGIFRKELYPIYMDCPQILNVFKYDPENFSYLMERADKNLFEYLRKEVDIKMLWMNYLNKC